jgi:integrase/recombinase XerD
MLGHASLNTTQIYTRLTTQRLKAALETHHPLAKGKGAAPRFGKRGRP